jgi:hypothetical protein
MLNTEILEIGSCGDPRPVTRRVIATIGGYNDAIWR